MRATEILETADSVEKVLLLEALREATSALSKADMDRDRFEEAMQGLDGYMMGWHAANAEYGDEGPSLGQLHQASRMLRPLAQMSGHVRGGLELLTSYTWDGGIHYGLPPIVERRENQRGRQSVADLAPKMLRDRINHPTNQRNYFRQAARNRQTMALYCDGQPFYVGDDVDYTLRAIPITEITADYRNPDHGDEVWAYRRSWWRQVGVGNPQEKVEWIFANGFIDKRTKTISYNGKREPVSQTKRMFTSSPNRPDGWAYGVPDALGGVAWVEKYKDALIQGKKMADAMAKLWGTMKVGDQKGANAAAALLRQMGDEKVGIVGPNGAIASLGTAGQGYDYAKSIDLLAAFAAHIGVSVVALSANPATAGGSYGASKALDLPEQKRTNKRRQFHIDLDREILVWMGASPDIDIWFKPLEDESELYRRDQRIALRTGTGLFDGQESKEMFADADGRTTIGPVPEGWLLPNNEKSLARKDIDADAVGNPANGSGLTPAQGSSAQFTGGGSGDQDFSR